MHDEWAAQEGIGKLESVTHVGTRAKGSVYLYGLERESDVDMDGAKVCRMDTHLRRACRLGSRIRDPICSPSSAVQYAS